MILFDTEIEEAMENGSIVIDPFIPENLGVNSYDVRLAPDLYVYDFHRISMNEDSFCSVLDMRGDNPVKKITIPEEGMVLTPGTLYLGATIEKVGTTGRYVPHIEGRSSVGRLGMAIHVTAGFGDCGFIGAFTMEITVVHSLRVYAGSRVGQVYFLEGRGVPSKLYGGKYAGFDKPVGSLMHKDVEWDR